MFVVNSAQIAYGTLNVNETLALAARQANALAPLLRNGVGPSVGATALGSQDNGGRAGAVTSSSRTVARPHMNDSRPLASISLDVDNLWSYMKTHGDAGWEQRPSYYDVFFGTALRGA